MHELPVTESILEIALRHAQKADAYAASPTCTWSSVNWLRWWMIRSSSIGHDCQRYHCRGRPVALPTHPGRVTLPGLRESLTPGDEILACPKCQSVRRKGDSRRGNSALDSIDVEMQTLLRAYIS